MNRRNFLKFLGKGAIAVAYFCWQSLLYRGVNKMITRLGLIVIAICVLMGAINLPYAIEGNDFNIGGVVFCWGMAVVNFFIHKKC